MKKGKMESNTFKQKKILIKKVMAWVRQGFNQRNQGFHPFLLCSSIKPTIQSKKVSIQSYPNAELWRCLGKLKDKDFIKEIQEEICEKLLQLKNYDSQLLKEFSLKVKNNFDFTFLFKQSYQKQGEFEENQEEQNFQNNISVQDFQIKQESESKSLLKQIQLCNQGSIITFENSHYHKLSQLLEKIKVILNQSSTELVEFYNGLEVFLESQQLTNSKKVKVEISECYEFEEQNKKSTTQQESRQDIQLINEQQQNSITKNKKQIKEKQQLQQQLQQQNIITQKIKSKEDLLREIKLESLQLEPGLVLFLPNYDKMQDAEAVKIREIEEAFFKELYCLKILNPEKFNSQSILYLWRTNYEIIFEKPTNLLPLFFQNKIKQE